MIYGKKYNVILLLVILTVAISGCGTGFRPNDTEEALDEIFQEKAYRAALYVDAAGLAESEGRPYVSVYLKEAAGDEIRHLKIIAGLRDVPDKNLVKLMEDIKRREKEAFHSRYPRAASLARDEYKDNIAAALEGLAEDEERHYRALKRILKEIK